MMPEGEGRCREDKTEIKADKKRWPRRKEGEQGNWEWVERGKCW